MKLEEKEHLKNKNKSNSQKLRESNIFKSKIIHNADDTLHNLSWFIDNNEYLSPDNIMLKSDHYTPNDPN